MYKNLKDNFQTHVDFMLEPYKKELKRLKNIETYLLIGQVTLNFEEKVRNNHNLESTIYFCNLPEELQMHL